MTLNNKQLTCSAPVNIAVIKYWGKRDESLILPTNSSLSLTLDQDHLSSKTTIALSQLSNDKLVLNGNEMDISCSKRLFTVINHARDARKCLEDKNDELEKLSLFKLLIVSSNNFPTAAGLASSASGFACLTFTLCQLYELPWSLQEASRLARLGSGSACRSLFGGYVAWDMGIREDGSDSLAVQIMDQQGWPDMECLILVVSDSKKDVGSTSGMQNTVLTSQLLQARIKTVDAKMKAMIKSIKSRDFNSFAELTMMDSNQFHSVCLDTYPPIFYLNDISKGIIQTITKVNEFYKERGQGYKVAYTFDAGPNAVLFLPKENVPLILSVIDKCFPTTRQTPEYYGRSLEFQKDKKECEFLESTKPFVYPVDSLKRIISTRVGDGPRILAKGFDPQVSLIEEDGITIKGL